MFKIIIYILNITTIFGISLQDAYNSAEPADGYDKYVMLDANIVYTGGLGLFEGNIKIDGNGAVIDLQSGGGIWVYGEAAYPCHVDIQECSVKNSDYFGISYAGTSTGSIINCNLIENDFGVKLFDSTHVVIKNCNFISNTTYGLGIYSEIPIAEISYCNAWNNGDADYMENCPN
jgi:hypothetical protein